MARIRNRCRAVRSDSDRGATAVEYGIMAGSIALVIYAAVSMIGSNLGALIADAAGMF